MNDYQTLWQSLDAEGRRLDERAAIHQFVGGATKEDAEKYAAHEWRADHGEDKEKLLL